MQPFLSQLEKDLFILQVKVSILCTVCWTLLIIFTVIIFVLKFERYSPSQYFLSPHHPSCTVRRNHYFVTLGSERDKFNYYSATCIFLSLSQLNCSYVEFYVLLGILLFLPFGHFNQYPFLLSLNSIQVRRLQDIVWYQPIVSLQL